MFDAVVMSDLHLGSPACQVDKIESFLDEMPPTWRLILNGDILESSEHRLTKKHWHILSCLRKLSDNTRLVWVRGNHDHDADSTAHLIGAEFVEEYEFVSGQNCFLVVHGDRWDRFITDYPVLTNIADWCYLRLQLWSRSIAVRTKRSSKTFQRLTGKVRAAAVEYAKGRIILCGHTHHAESVDAYYNTGCWTDDLCHFVTIQDGEIQLRGW